MDRVTCGFDLSDYTGQFLFSRLDVVKSARWRIRELDSWRLSHHESLRVTPIVACDGTSIGCFLGCAIASSGRVVAGECTAPFGSCAEVESDSLEAFLYDHGGRWAFLLLTNSFSRIYLDPCGSLALVFNVDQPRIASTTTLLGSRSKFGSNWLDTGDSHFPVSNQFFPLGLTGDKRIRRLLPNHYLDLSSMSTARHWPRAPIIRVSHPSEISRSIAGIVHHVQTNSKALVREAPLYLSLTAGRDSRMLLACSRDIVDQITCFTFNEPKGTGPVDVRLARLLCAKFALSHENIPIEPVDDATRQEYLQRIGYAGNAGKAKDFLQASRRYLDPSKLWLIGYAGEVGRSFYWKKSDSENTTVNPRDLLCRLGLPTSDPFVDHMIDWSRGLEMLDFFGLLDIMYLELRMGTWAAPHLYGCAGFRNVVLPLCHRRIIELMLQLPVQYRWRQRLATDVIRITWPELLHFPFQRTPGMFGLWRYIRDRRLRPCALRMIDSLGEKQGSSKTYDIAYSAARALYRSVKK